MTIDRRTVLRTMIAVGALGAAVAAPFAHAQAWPSRQVTVVVSFPPGGDTDALARVFAEKLSPRVGQPVVVENRTGASGTIGNSSVAKAAPDGHTLLFTPNTFSTAPLVLKAGTGAPYDVLNDFTPIIQVGNQQLFVIVNAQSGITSMQELVAAAKAGRVTTYGSPGSGSPMHILGAMFNKSAGINIQQVPYRGSGPAIVDMVAGHIPMMYSTLGPVAQHIAAGKLRNLAVADARRSSLAPDVPTLAELGFKDAEVAAWQGFMGPRGMSPQLVATINGHINEILKQPDVVQRMTALALIPLGGAPEVLRARNASDFERFGKAIKEFNIQAE